MTTASIVVTVVALLIAALSLSVTVYGLKQKTDDTYTARLEKEIDVLKADAIQGKRELAECRAAKNEATDQIFRLYLRIDELEATIRRGSA